MWIFIEMCELFSLVAVDIYSAGSGSGDLVAEEPNMVGGHQVNDT